MRLASQRSLIGSVLALLVVHGSATAGAPGERKSRGEFFLQAFTGLGLTEDSDLRIRRVGDTQLRFSQVEWDDNSLSGPSARYTGVRFGYFLKGRPWLAVSVEFLHYKVFAEVGQTVAVQGTNQGVPIDAVLPMNTIVQAYNISNGVNLLPVSITGRLRKKRSERFPDGRIQPYAGVGVGPTLLYTQSVVSGAERKGPYEWGNLAAQLLAGVRISVSPHGDLFTEYKRTYTEANGSVDSGTSRTELHSNHFVVGGGFRF